MSQATTEAGIAQNPLLADVYSLSELKEGDKVTLQFAQLYTRQSGWSQFYKRDYFVKKHEGKSVVFQDCQHSHTCHRMFNVGGMNEYEWVVGKHIC